MSGSVCVCVSVYERKSEGGGSVRICACVTAKAWLTASLYACVCACERVCTCVCIEVCLGVCESCHSSAVRMSEWPTVSGPCQLLTAMAKKKTSN